MCTMWGCKVMRWLLLLVLLPPHWQPPLTMLKLACSTIVRRTVISPYGDAQKVRCQSY